MNYFRGVLTFFALLGALAAEILVLIYGIMASIPMWPFEYRDPMIGHPLILASVLWIASLLGCIAFGTILPFGVQSPPRRNGVILEA